MNAEARDRILQRVRKMLRLAADAGATEGERDNAMRMAHATLAKHNLDLATVESDSDEPRIENVVTLGGWPWARSVCHSVAELFFCHYIYSGSRSVSKTSHYFIGRTSNATTAALVAEFVVTAVHREAQKLSRKCYGGSGFVRSFGWGVASRIRDRVQQLKADNQQLVDPESTNPQPTSAADLTQKALVLVSVYSSEEKANATFLAKKYPNLRSRISRSYIGHAGAFASGQAFADTVSLAPQLPGRRT